MKILIFSWSNYFLLFYNESYILFLCYIYLIMAYVIALLRMTGRHFCTILCRLLSVAVASGEHHFGVLSYTVA